MARWEEFEQEAPQLAAKVKSRLEAQTHLVIATLRKDGSPRISGIEATFANGDLWCGSMWNGRKARDLQGDNRFALHSGTVDPPEWDGDAKVSGRAIEIDDAETVVRVYGESAPKSRFHLFRLEIEIASYVGLTEDRNQLRVEYWTPQDGLRVMTRD